MLYWAVVFLVIALVAALFGFGGIAETSAGIAQILFIIFLILFVVTVLRQARARTALIGELPEISGRADTRYGVRPSPALAGARSCLA